MGMDPISSKQETQEEYERLLRKANHLQKELDTSNQNLLEIEEKTRIFLLENGIDIKNKVLYVPAQEEALIKVFDAIQQSLLDDLNMDNQEFTKKSSEELEDILQS